MVERLLDGEGGLGEKGREGRGEGVVIRRRRKGDTEKVRKLAKRLSQDVQLLKKEKEEYTV